MNYFNTLEQLVNATLEAMAQAGELPREALGRPIAVDPPRDPAHGDAATNAAMVLAKPAGLNPRQLGEALAARLADDPAIASAEVAGPGFVNLRLTGAFWHDRLREILAAGTAYGAADFGAGEKVNVEYVSANPTGPLHIAHARGAIIGDALAALLAKTGYDVTREYYINDAGAQVEALARSAYLRYREACGITIDEIPEGLYPGEYLVPVGEALAARDGETWLEAPEEEWLPAVRDFTVATMMEGIRADLKRLGIEQGVFASERELVEAGAVEAALDALKAKGLLYRGVLEPPKGVVPEDWEEREQLLFRATEFGDDTDRPLLKSDGSYTYFANDIAYHYDKFERGFRIQVDVWGADHGGYVKRMKSAVDAITGGEAELTVLLCQIVRLMRGGEMVRMSKRAGTFVTLRDLIEEVGAGAVRFTMLTRKSDAPFDFDLDKALEQSRDNPVFYVQYAHARCRSVFRNAAADFAAGQLAPDALAQADLALLETEDERELIAKMAAWPRAVEGAARAFEPHRIAFYLYDLASAFHAFWNKGREDATLRFIDADKPELTLARLALVEGLRTVIASGLELYGVEPMEELR